MPIAIGGRRWGSGGIMGEEMGATPSFQSAYDAGGEGIENVQYRPGALTGTRYAFGTRTRRPPTPGAQAVADIIAKGEALLGGGSAERMAHSAEGRTGGGSAAVMERPGPVWTRAEAGRQVVPVGAERMAQSAEGRTGGGSAEIMGGGMPPRMGFTPKELLDQGRISIQDYYDLQSRSDRPRRIAMENVRAAGMPEREAAQMGLAVGDIMSRMPRSGTIMGAGGRPGAYYVTGAGKTDIVAAPEEKPVVPVQSGSIMGEGGKPGAYYITGPGGTHLVAASEPQTGGLGQSVAVYDSEGNVIGHVVQTGKAGGQFVPPPDQPLAQPEVTEQGGVKFARTTARGPYKPVREEVAPPAVAPAQSKEIGTATKAKELVQADLDKLYELRLRRVKTVGGIYPWAERVGKLTGNVQDLIAQKEAELAGLEAQLGAPAAGGRGPEAGKAGVPAKGNLPVISGPGPEYDALPMGAPFRTLDGIRHTKGAK